MERKATTANHDVADEGNQEDSIVAIFQAVPDPFNAEGYKQKICEGVDDLGTVNSGIVVL